jgi:hypothetical protein
MTEAERQTVTDSLQGVFKADREYAWEWQCAIAEGMRQAGCDPKLAHQGAARFLEQQFTVPMREFAEYHHLMETWK